MQSQVEMKQCWSSECFSVFAIREQWHDWYKYRGFLTLSKKDMFFLVTAMYKSCPHMFIYHTFKGTKPELGSNAAMSNYIYIFAIMLILLRLRLMALGLLTDTCHYHHFLLFTMLICPFFLEVTPYSNAPITLMFTTSYSGVHLGHWP